MLFSEKIKYLMKRNGITQRELSESIGVNQPTISRWVKGQKPYSRAINALSERFDIAPDLLLDDEITIDEFISESNTNKISTGNQICFDLFEKLYGELGRKQLVDITIKMLLEYANGDDSRLEMVLTMLNKLKETSK